MTLHMEDDAADIAAIQIGSVKDLERQIEDFKKAYAGKESEFNWEKRNKGVTIWRGLLRGNATQLYLKVLIPQMRDIIDGVVKAVESLRTQLSVNALLLVGDIGYYMRTNLDNHSTEHLFDCMLGCASLTKKMVASKSLDATRKLLRYTSYYPAIAKKLKLSMDDKSNQVRLYAVIYAKEVLQAHARNPNARSYTDVDCIHFETVLIKGLNDPIKGIKEESRELFWIFVQHWEDRKDGILRGLSESAQKELERSKNNIAVSVPIPARSRSTHSPTMSPRASSSLSRRNDNISPSDSTGLSSGSAADPYNISQSRKSLSPRATSPHLRTSYTSLSSTSSQLGQQSSSISTSPTQPTRKTRVPALNHKKSSSGLNTKRKPSFMTLLNSDDPTMRADGLLQLAKKLSQFPYIPDLRDLSHIQLDVPNVPAPVDGEALKSIVVSLMNDPVHAEFFSSWEGVTNIMLRLFTFEEYIPRLVLDAYSDESSRRTTEVDVLKHELATQALVRAKQFLQVQNPDLVDLLFTRLIQYGGFVTKTPTMPTTPSFSQQNKKDFTKIPDNRRKLTKQFLEWMDELVKPIIGLCEDIDYQNKAYEGIPEEYMEEPQITWFESDDNVRQMLAILLPPVVTSSGPKWLLPLTIFIKHIRLLNQRLFEKVVATYDSQLVSKICKVLEIHLRVEPLVSLVPTVDVALDTPMIEDEELIEQMDDEHTSIIEEPLLLEEQEKEEIDPVIIEEKKERQEVQDGNQLPMSEIPDVTQTKALFHDIHVETAADINTDVYQLIQEEITSETVINDLNNLSLQEERSDISIGHNKEKVLPTIQTKYEDIVAKEEKDMVAAGLATATENMTIKDSPSPDYFSSKQVMAETDSPTQITDSLYEDTSITTTDHIRTGTQVVAPALLQPSFPNADKYPVPKYVSFFAPEKVSFPNPVFKQNVRTTIANGNHSTTTNATATHNRNAKDKTILLYALIDKLKSSSSPSVTTTTTVDENKVITADTFRKLTKLFKEVPIRRRWDQGGNEENGSETWSGAQNDAGNFVETVQAMLLHLEPKNVVLAALECTRQLAVTHAGLFRFYERKVDENGMTLESHLLEKLLSIRSSENPTICIAAEDALDAVLGTLNPPTAFEMLMAFIIHQLVILDNKEVDMSKETRYHPVGSAFMYLSKWVKEVNDSFYIDEWLAKGGVNAFFKGINHPLISIRKSCVEAIVAFQEVVGDHIYQVLADLREDQLSLLRHYVMKSMKKKANLRNLRDNNNNI